MDEPKLTRRMKWIVKMLKEHPDAVIRHHRDAFLEKSAYELEWGGNNGTPYEAHEVTKRLKNDMVNLGLIIIVEHRPIYTKGGEFVTTERDYGLPR
jgi:hypothetical protein